VFLGGVDIGWGGRADVGETGGGGFAGWMGI